MKLFTCDHCQQTLFFENNRCMACGSPVGYIPELARMVTLRRATEQPGTFDVPLTGVESRRYRQCFNTLKYDVCNWLMSADGAGIYCRSCELTEIIPDLSDAANVAAWRRIEAAKRRLLYTLYSLRLPVKGRAAEPETGLAFQFLKGSVDQPVITGHGGGVITLNIDEADPAFRENMRDKMGEVYRTLLGHLRHEVGHYYWRRLVAPASLAAFRELFGDERASYEQAIERHYAWGPPANWGESFISAYASMHPWEDFAETWAHYLHMLDTLETAKSHGLAINLAGASGERIVTDRLRFFDFDALTTGWNALTLALNSLNRSMGLEDAYPFVLTPRVIEKLRYVHDLVQSTGRSSGQVEMSG
jgi:hypothetical protein